MRLLDESPTKVFPLKGPQARKRICPICDTSGYGLEMPDRYNAAPWQRHCMEGHPFHCCCGRMWPSRSALAAHISGNAQHHPKDHHCRKRGIV